MQIRWNTEMQRWEVYSSRGVIRAYELQPVFVSARLEECERYVKEVQKCGT